MDENLIHIKSGDWDLVVDLNGGRLSMLRKKGILIFGTFDRIDGKKANTHVCVPNFGMDGAKKYDLPQHGPFRNAPWELVQKTEDSLEINCVGLGLDVRQFFSFSGEYFNHKLTVENRSQEDKPVNLAIHNYWSSDLGWQGVNLNKINIAAGVRNDDWINLKQINEIDIPGKPIIKWQVMGFRYGRLWSGSLKEGGNKIFDNNYFCLEPVMERKDGFFGSPESMLQPGKMVEVRQMIAVIDEEK